MVTVLGLVFVLERSLTHVSNSLHHSKKRKTSSFSPFCFPFSVTGDTRTKLATRGVVKCLALGVKLTSPHPLPPPSLFVSFLFSSCTLEANRIMREKPGIPDRHPFPQTLYKILQDCSKGDFSYTGVRWTAGGNEIEISQPQFVANTLGKYFRTTKYTSFSRNLNLYGFRRNAAAACESVYSHPDFRQSDYESVTDMRRPKKTLGRSDEVMVPLQTPAKSQPRKAKKGGSKRRSLDNKTPCRGDAPPLPSSVTPGQQLSTSAFSAQVACRPTALLETQAVRDDVKGEKRKCQDSVNGVELRSSRERMMTMDSPPSSPRGKTMRKRQKVMKENISTLAALLAKEAQENSASRGGEGGQEDAEPPLPPPRKLVRLVSRDNQMTLLEQVFPNDLLQFPPSTNCNCNCKVCIYCRSNCDSPTVSDAFPRTPPQKNDGCPNTEHRAISPLSLAPANPNELELRLPTKGHALTMSASSSSFFC
jgi:hypothetical protein